MIVPRILILEDKPIHQRLVYLMAKRLGLAPTMASTCQEGVRLLEHGPSFAAVFIDYDIPHNPQSVECVQLIKKTCAQKGVRIPVVAMTAYALQSEKEQCFQAGVDDYLSKPFSGQQFAEVVHRWTDVEPHRASRAS